MKVIVKEKTEEDKYLTELPHLPFVIADGDGGFYLVTSMCDSPKDIAMTVLLSDVTSSIGVSYPQYEEEGLISDINDGKYKVLKATLTIENE